MRSILLIVSALLAIQVYFGNAAPNTEKMMEILEKCKQKQGNDGGLLAAIKEKNLPNSEEGKCMLACMFEEAGMIKGNAYSKAGALMLADKLLTSNPEKLEKVKALAETCAKEVGEAPGNRCEVAFHLADCAKRNGDGTVFHM